MNVLAIEGGTRNEKRQLLVVHLDGATVLLYDARLPPIQIVVVDDAEHVAALELDAEIAARNVGIFRRIVLEQRAQVELRNVKPTPYTTHVRT